MLMGGVKLPGAFTPVLGAFFGDLELLFGVLGAFFAVLSPDLGGLAGAFCAIVPNCTVIMLAERRETPMRDTRLRRL